jgi:TrmH family RNA methyltransferase
MGMVHLPVRVILLQPEKAGNIGAVSRSMKNFGLEDLWIVDPKAPLDGEARAFAMGGRTILSSAKIVGALKDALKGVDVVAGTSSVTAKSSTNLSRISITAEQLAKKVASTKGKVGIVFGRESSGLSNEEVEDCDFMVNIPANHEYNVLNIATAASIVFYEIFQRRIVGKIELASGTEKNRLLKQFDQLTRLCEVQSHKRRLAQRAFRNVISRSFIARREASLILGVLRKASSRLV